MSENQDKITFTASLPPITSAISISGIGEGARVKLDLPASEMMAVLKLQMLAGKTFKMTVEEVID